MTADTQSTKSVLFPPDRQTKIQNMPRFSCAKKREKTKKIKPSFMYFAYVDMIAHISGNICSNIYGDWVYFLGLAYPVRNYLVNQHSIYYIRLHDIFYICALFTCTYKLIYPRIWQIFQLNPEKLILNSRNLENQA